MECVAIVSGSSVQSAGAARAKTEKLLQPRGLFEEVCADNLFFSNLGFGRAPMVRVTSIIDTLSCSALQSTLESA